MRAGSSLQRWPGWGKIQISMSPMELRIIELLKMLNYYPRMIGRLYYDSIDPSELAGGQAFRDAQNRKPRPSRSFEDRPLPCHYFASQAQFFAVRIRSQHFEPCFRRCELARLSFHHLLSGTDLPDFNSLRPTNLNGMFQIYAVNFDWIVVRVFAKDALSFTFLQGAIGRDSHRCSAKSGSCDSVNLHPLLASFPCLSDLLKALLTLLSCVTPFAMSSNSTEEKV